MQQRNVYSKQKHSELKESEKGSSNCKEFLALIIEKKIFV